MTCTISFPDQMPVVGQVIRIAFENLRGPDDAILNPLPSGLKIQMQVNEGTPTDITTYTATGPGAGYFLYTVAAVGRHDFALTSPTTGLIAQGRFEAYDPLVG